MTEPYCPRCQAFQRRVAELEQWVNELTRLFDEAQRAGKQQASPFRKGEPEPNRKRPGH
jgi:hypothetical protein